MGKPTGKKKNSGGKSNDGNGKANKACEKSSKAFDEDTVVFIAMSQELKEEGNKLFQKRDHEGAMLKYEKALKLLPRNHVDVAYLRNNMAACYMQMGLGEYPRAISECNLALEVIPKYSKALLRRAKCYESLNKIDLAWKDVNSVLNMEPNNLTALDIQEKIKKAMAENGLKVDEKFVEPLGDRTKKAIEEKGIKVGEKTKKPIEEKDDKVNEKHAMKEKMKKKNGKVEEKKVEDKVVVEEKVEIIKEKVVVTKSVKLIFEEDIRWAQMPVNCSVGLVRDIVRDRFPSLKGVLIKYRDEEGDLVTITTTDELRLAEKSGELHGSIRLFIIQVNPDQEPFYEGMSNVDEVKKSNLVENWNMEEKEGIDEWIVQFARLFKNHVGFNSDSYLDLHEIGMKLYSEAMEDTISSEESQELFVIAAEKFQEMAALALFNWGNVHMSRARKRVFFTEDGSSETILSQIKSAYDWAQKEHVKAGMRYEEALKIKNDFYEGFLALGQQQFEQAKLSWYYAIANKVDLETWNSMEVLQLYNKAEDSMERGMQLLEEMEEQQLNGLSRMDKYKTQLEKLGLAGLLKEISASEASEQSTNIKSQIYLLWGSLLYERSIVEYKLGLPVWEECLEVAVEKFELAGASPTDIAVMIKSHCSNGTALEGLGFRIDELVQAWHEMYDAKRCQSAPSFRLEPLLRRRPSKLNYILEHV